MKTLCRLLLLSIVIALIIVAFAALLWATLAKAAVYDVVAARPYTPIRGTLLSETYNLPSPAPIAAPTPRAFELYPILKRISACESMGNPNATPRQFNSDGSILWGNDPKTGKPITRDIGIFQINTWVWGTLASSMGDDLKTEAGNLAFGEYLYLTYGTSPWAASKGCWSYPR